MKRFLLLIALMVLSVTGHAGAATDVAAAGHGTGTLKHDGVTCTGPLAVSINVRANHAVVTENWGPGNPGIEACTAGSLFYQYEADTAPYPPVQQCMPNFAITTGNAYTLTQVGQVYTLQASYRLCSGKQAVDRIVVTVKPTQIIYKHTYTNGTVVEVDASGTVPRVA